MVYKHVLYIINIFPGFETCTLKMPSLTASLFIEGQVGVDFFKLLKDCETRNDFLFSSFVLGYSF